MRDERLVGLFSIMLLLFACSSQNKTTGPNADEQNWRIDTVVISFERTACFGQCPTFKADFWGDGTVRYHGIDNVENDGHFEGKVDKTQLEALYKKAEAIDFFNMADKYDAQVTDIPSQIYFIEMYGKEKKIYARYRTPEALKDFGALIDGVLNGIQWHPAEGQDH